MTLPLEWHSRLEISVNYMSKSSKIDAELSGGKNREKWKPSFHHQLLPMREMLSDVVGLNSRGVGDHFEFWGGQASTNACSRDKTYGKTSQFPRNSPQFLFGVPSTLRAV